jgi:SAM-dependent methyltransferase
MAQPWGEVGICPHCGAYARHRELWLFLLRRTNVPRGRMSLLHFAPEPVLQGHLAAFDNLEYTSADLHSDLAEHRVDIQELPFAGDRFDLIVCSHVLEHVEDDRRAMSELLRVLKPGGAALVMAPTDPELPETYEDPTITAPKDRERAFRQTDHFRLYGADLPARLEGEGFRVECESLFESADEATRRRHGLGPHDPIFVCRKPAGPPAAAAAFRVLDSAG